MDKRDLIWQLESRVSDSSEAQKVSQWRIRQAAAL